MLLIFTLEKINYEKLGEKKALIFGITGQDGSYLAEFLLKKNIVHGVKEDPHLYTFKLITFARASCKI